MKGGDELSLKDITFLRAIRDINGSPERYASTDEGVTSASVIAITEATTLTEEEVAYRLDHPRLGKSGLVKVYESGPPGDDSATLNSAELTKAGEEAIADAAERQASVDEHEWHPDEEQSEFDGMQEWEPAEVESGATAGSPGEAPKAEADGGEVPGGAVPETGTAAATEGPALPPGAGATPDSERTQDPEGTHPSESDGEEGETSVETERLTALERRVEELEGESPSPQTAPDTDPEAERVETLSDEVAALRETTERLEATVQQAVSELEAIQSAEYGALNEKREEQLRTAVDSMVAFHQLATEVLDVRVENFEPDAGRPDPERVEITRNRIGDALGVGKTPSGGGGMTLSGGDSEWPSPSETAGGRVFGGRSQDDEKSEEPEPESDAPDSGVYPPIGESDDSEDSPRNVADEGDEEPDSDVPDSGVYPPIGSEDEEEQDGESEGESATDHGSEPAEEEEATPRTDEATVTESLAVDAGDEVDESIRETAFEAGHVMEAIRTTADHRTPPLRFDAMAGRTVRSAIRGGGGDVQKDAPHEPRLSTEVTADTFSTVRTGVVAANGERGAYARVVGDASPDNSAQRDGSEVSGLPAERADFGNLTSGRADDHSVDSGMQSSNSVSTDIDVANTDDD